MFHFNVDLKALRLLADLQVSGKFVPGSGCIDTKCCLTLFTSDSQESRVTKKRNSYEKHLAYSCRSGASAFVSALHGCSCVHK